MENTSKDFVKEELKQKLGTEEFNNIFKQHINSALIEHTTPYNNYSSWLTAGEGAFLIALSSQYEFLSTNSTTWLLNMSVAIFALSIFTGALLKLSFIILTIRKSLYQQVFNILIPAIEEKIKEKMRSFESIEAEQLEKLLTTLPDEDRLEILGISYRSYYAHVRENTPRFLKWYLAILKTSIRIQGTQRHDSRILSVITISFLFMSQVTTLILGFILFLISIF